MNTSYALDKSNAKLLGYLSAIGFYELPLTYIDDYPRLIGSITSEQVRAAFASHLNKDNLVTVIVGDREKVAPGIARLNMGAPAELTSI